jgi:5-formyltetrahydrofolate cyclo-ligase
VPPPATASKAEWRRWASRLPAVGGQQAHVVVAHLATLLRDIEGPVVGYVALADEVPIDDLVPRPRCLPRLGDDGAMTLHVDDGPRERHQRGIHQPPPGVAVVDPSTVAVVLVPGRVFDRAGYRLGRGGGHYDRLVPTLAPGTLVIGVATEARVVDRLPREPHDRPMTHLATEQGVISTK